MATPHNWTDSLQEQDIFCKLRTESDRVDQLLCDIWPDDIPSVSLIATGGYGRRALFPHSDIDLLILYETQLPDDHKIHDTIQQFWQHDLTISHSVRSLNQCLSDAAEDLNFYTSLLEARPLKDPASLLAKLTRTLQDHDPWARGHFFTVKYQEQKQRHQKYALNLEPNVKEAPGGLRDIHSIRWMTSHYLGLADMEHLHAKTYLTTQEKEDCLEAITFLCEIRYRLHTLTGKGENRLLFDYQKELATQLGYQDDQNLQGVEHFMQHYYQHTHTISVINELILQLLHEELLDTYNGPETTPINAYFQRKHTYLDHTDTADFAQHPALVLESYVMLCQHPELSGFSARLIRLLREHSLLIDDHFRAEPQHKALFMSLLKQPQGVYHQLRNMLRYGTLIQYIPDFSHVFGQMQFDLYHTYTVDRHTMQLLKELRQIVTGEATETLPLCDQVIQMLPDLSLLYLAALFHDIGKGRGCDHSSWGAEAVKKFALDHDLTVADADLVSWLVKHHLLMSLTAQKTDISDPDVIQRFAQRVGTQDRLNYLYVLTVADIRATNISLWNGWRDSLLKSLYHSTTLELAQTIEISHANSAEQTKQAILQRARDPNALEKLWKTWPEPYFCHYAVETIEWHLHTVMSSKTPLEPRIQARIHPNHEQCEIFLYLKRQNYLFATLMSIIDRLNLNIVQARTDYTQDEFLLLSIVVLNRDHAPLTIEEQQELCNTLRDDLRHICEPKALSFQHRRQHHKTFSIDTKIEVQPAKHNCLTLNLTTMDYPGLLAEVSKVFTLYNLRVHHAQINTVGERAEDYFILGLAEQADVDRVAEQLKATLRDVLVTD